MSTFQTHEFLDGLSTEWGLGAEPGAWFARAYGLMRDELHYILGPANVHGPDFPGETFRVLKEMEQANLGEDHIRSLMLEAWDASAAGNGQG